WEAAYGKSYRVQKSQDGINWADVYAATNADGSDDYIDFDPPFVAQYIRLYGQERGTPYGYSLWELQVFAIPTELAGSVKVPDAYAGIYTIAEAVAAAGRNYRLNIIDGTYEENVVIADTARDIVLCGAIGHASVTTVKGAIALLGTSATFKDLHLLYDNQNPVSYNNLELIGDAAVTAVDSGITVRDCIIDAETTHTGKGIQIWNMYGSSNNAPTIENNLIMNTDTGIGLFSQVFGGAIKGRITNNTFVANNRGILLRMHKENPLIKDNIITGSSDGIHISYQDGTLLNDRIPNITGNVLFDNDHNVWCDALQEELAPLPDKATEQQDNLYIDPQLDTDYLPQDPEAQGKGYIPQD
ncbi:MAG: discoidin domain-containing protein, partial [Candidatus Omnitrophica bacterium]|nr:discoidin domain-containing protein [Candidatus Omnitrophota bacterium]